VSGVGNISSYRATRLDSLASFWIEGGSTMEDSVTTGGNSMEDEMDNKSEAVKTSMNSFSVLTVVEDGVCSVVMMNIVWDFLVISSIFLSFVL
jgi:hypothetical protein